MIVAPRLVNKMVKKGAYRKSRDKCVDDDEWGYSIYNIYSSPILSTPDRTNGGLISSCLQCSRAVVRMGNFRKPLFLL